MKRPQGGGPFIERALPGALATLWLVVAVALFLRMGLGNYRLSSRVCRQRPVTRPEVLDVVGKIGRSESALDPAPISMIETVITLRPESSWRE